MDMSASQPLIMVKVVGGFSFKDFINPVPRESTVEYFVLRIEVYRTA